jgi:two-component system chemotaxis response regulator CheY
MATILLIEDDDNLRETIAMGLGKEGYGVLQAEDGEQGLRLLKTNPVDAVLTDIVMPNMDGLEMIKKMRASFPSLPIVAISGGAALNAPLYLKMASAMGADRTVRKPFMLQEVTQAITDVIESRKKPKGTAPP